MFSNMKIGTRLTLGFGAVVLLLIAAIAIGLYDIRALRSNIETVGLDTFPKTAQQTGVAQTAGNLALAAGPDEAQFTRF